MMDQSVPNIFPLKHRIYAGTQLLPTETTAPQTLSLTAQAAGASTFFIGA